MDKGDANAPVNPVRDVQCPIGTERGQVVGRDVLSLARTLQHEKLGEDSHSLEPDRERPQHFGQVELVVENERQDKARSEQVLDAEGVDGGVVCGSRRMVGAACQRPAILGGIWRESGPAERRG